MEVGLGGRRGAHGGGEGQDRVLTLTLTLNPHPHPNPNPNPDPHPNPTPNPHPTPNPKKVRTEFGKQFRRSSLLSWAKLGSADYVELKMVLEP